MWSRFTHHRLDFLRILYDSKYRRHIELKKKKPRRRKQEKAYQQLTDLDEYPRTSENKWDKREKDQRRG